MCASAAFSAAAVAQTPAPPPEPNAVFGEVRAAYRAGVTTEHMRVTVRQGTSTARRATIALRVEPGADSAARIQAGRLLVQAQAGTVVVALDRDSGPYLQQKYDGPLSPGTLDACVPPLPIPQLALALTPAADSVPDLCAYARAIAWDSATAEPREPTAGGTFVLSGHCTGGTLILTADSRTHRLRQVVVVLGSEPQQTRITIECLAAAGSLMEKPLDLANRSRVESLAELAKAAGGDTMTPRLDFGDIMEMEGRTTTAARMFASETPDGPAPERVVFLFVRISRERSVDARAARTAADIRAFLSADGSGSARIGLCAVLVVDAPGGVGQEQLNAIASAAAEFGEETHQAIRRVYWTAVFPQFLEADATDADGSTLPGAVAIVAADGKVEMTCSLKDAVARLGELDRPKP